MTREFPEKVSNKMTGTIVRFFDERGFGFIYCDELKRRVFFHISKFGGAPNPEVNQVVTFDLAPGKEGQPDKAINVMVVPVAGLAALATPQAEGGAK